MVTDGSKKILLVEDEPVVAMMQSRILSNNDYDVTVAHTGEQAIELINMVDNINLILMDIDLGIGMDGTEAAKIILEKEEIPLVFLSSHTEKDIVNKTEGITSYGYIVKDTGETVLLASIKMAFKLFDAKLKEREKERALELSENRYFTLFDNISSGVAIYEAKDNGNDFIFKDVNKASVSIDGFDKDNIIGESVIKIRPAIVEFGLLEVFKRVWRTGKPEYFPLKIYKDENLDKYYDNYVYKLPTGEIVAVYNDYTEQKITEDNVKQNEERFYDLFLKHSAVKLLIRPIDGTIYDANYAAEKFYGWSREKLKTMNISEINCLDQKHMQEKMQKVIQAKENSFKFSHILADGSTKDVEVFSNEFIFKGEHLLHSIIHDITDKKGAEMAVEGNLEFLNKLFETIPVAVYYKDVEGRYLHVNNAFAEMIGLSKEHIINKTIYDVSYQELALFNSHKDQELIQNKKIQVYQTSYVSSQGKVHDVIVHKASVLNSNNKICGIIGIIFSIEKERLWFKRPV